LTPARAAVAVAGGAVLADHNQQEIIMDSNRALRILRALIEGVHPNTGEELSSDTVLHEPTVLRALLAAVLALEQQAVRSGRRSNLPANVGSRWTPAEEQRLVEAYQAGRGPQEFAQEFGRTLRAIESRLVRLGLMTPEQRTTSDSFTGGPSR
jgi:hypothetical protein